MIQNSSSPGLIHAHAHGKARPGGGGASLARAMCKSANLQVSMLVPVLRPASWASVPADRRSARCSRRMWMRCQMSRSRRNSVGGGRRGGRSNSACIVDSGTQGGGRWEGRESWCTADCTDRVERAVSKHCVAGCRRRIRCESHQSESEKRPPPQMAVCEAQESVTRRRCPVSTLASTGESPSPAHLAVKAKGGNALAREGVNTRGKTRGEEATIRCTISITLMSESRDHHALQETAFRATKVDCSLLKLGNRS